MEYAQLNEALTTAIQVTTHGNVEWDANNFCSAEALTRDGKAEQFRVVPLTVTEPPAIDPLTQSVIRDGCEIVDGQWQYRWTITDLDAGAVAANQAAKVAGKVDALWRAADAYTASYISGVAIGLLTLGVLQSLPKALAVSAWSSAVWDAYYTRKALVTVSSVDNLDFSSHGPMPHSVPELRAEMGM